MITALAHRIQRPDRKVCQQESGTPERTAYSVSPSAFADLGIVKMQFMCNTKNGELRQPVFKGLRTDKKPEDCVETY